MTINRDMQLLCAHCAVPYAILLGLGIFGIAGWLPIPLPSLAAEDFAQIFRDDTMRIRLGMTMLGFSSVLLWPFAAAISMQMRRVEGEWHPLSYVQMAAASGGVVAIIIPTWLWLAIAYRADTVSPQALQIINDFCWLAFIGMYPPGMIQNLAIGLCVLKDKSATPVYPRWMGYANLWIAVGFLPGALLPFFKTGPFAWNGLIGFWLVAFLFFGWIMMMWWMTVRAIRQQPEPAPA